MSISNQDIDSILNNLIRNGLGVNNMESIFTTDGHIGNRRSGDVNRNSRNNIGIETLFMLLTELNNRTNAQRIPQPNTRTSNNNFTEQNHHPPSPRNIQYPEFEEMVYSYNRNILEYNYTIQQTIESIATPARSRQRSAIGITEIYETGVQFNRNIQEYNKIMDNALDLYRDLHFGHNSHDRNNYSVPLSRNTETPATPATPLTPSTTNTLPVISRPQSMVSYTIFPFIPSVTSETDDILLSEIQIHDFTESFIYNSFDSSNISTSVCPISLESFQEGDSILKIRHCGHEFKSVSLRQWFRRSSRCPLCRCNLLTPSVNRTSRSPSVAFSDISMNVYSPETDVENTPATIPSSLPNTSGYRRSLDESVSGRLSALRPVENAGDSSSQNQVILPDSLGSSNENSNIIRELYSTLLNTTNDLDQSVFNNVFQNILMESTDAPPNISNAGVDSIPNIRPLIMSLLQNSLSSPIESIDITYTVDYDISNN